MEFPILRIRNLAGYMIFQVEDRAKSHAPAGNVHGI